MELNMNQAALILEADDDGEITGALCHAIAIKLMNDEQFQGELMEMLEEK